MTNLKEIRKIKGISQKEVSDRSGVNIRLIQDYEQGHKQINNAKAITVYNLAQALNCEVVDLLEIKKEVEE